MRHARWSIGVSAVTLSALVGIGGAPVGNIGLDAAAPALAALVGAVTLAAVLVRGRASRRLPITVRTAPQARRIGGPRVF